MATFARVRIAIVAAAIAIIIGATPALAKTVISQAGTRGEWSLKDTQAKPGATCKYSIYGDLYRIKVKPPKVFGRHASKTWVGWRYQIWRKTDSGWRKFDKSDVQKDKASRTKAADDFSARAWEDLGDDPPPHARYKVRIVILFYAPGSQTTVEGKVVVEDDWYKETYPTWYEPYMHSGYCSNGSGDD